MKAAGMDREVQGEHSTAT